jgi:putative methionine-R-sulfoxide reductase with GAF domain
LGRVGRAPGSGTVRAAGEQLRRIQSVTDAALAHLELDDLLSALLERVRELVEVDSAAVLLVDPASQELMATAASGLEEEVRQGVRIPLGRGFAGRIAAEAHPVIIEHVDHTNVLNPILWEKGIKSLLGVPLVAEGDVIGVLHVGSLTTRRFTDEDTELLQVVADRAALAIRARRSHVEHAAASVLQRSLLPSRFPAIAGLDIAARYLPGSVSGVGGDWYDVFLLPSGHIGVVIGDVVGKGLQAAVVMGRLRSALRAYALEQADPATVLTQLDRKIHHFEPDQMATVLYAVFEPSLDRLVLSCAGHPVPVLAAPGAPARFVDTPVDPPVGIDHQSPRHRTTVALPPGAVLCFYTDGLIERRTAMPDVRLERLRQLVASGPAAQTCQAILSNLVGAAGTADDLALLIIHRQCPPGGVRPVNPAED